MTRTPVSPDSDILSRGQSDRHLYAKLVEILPDKPSEPEPLFLDVRGMQVAAASFLRESVIAFRTLVRNRKSNFYPAVANAVTDVIDDLVEAVQSRGDVLMLCKLGLDGEAIRCRRIGTLDPEQQLTFDLVSRHGETTATHLMEIEKATLKLPHGIPAILAIA